MIKIFKMLYLSAIATFLMSSFWGMGAQLYYELIYIPTYQTIPITEGVYKIDHVRQEEYEPEENMLYSGLEIENLVLIIKKINEQEYLSKNGTNVKERVVDNALWGFDKLYFITEPEIEYYEFSLKLKFEGQEEEKCLLKPIEKRSDSEGKYYFTTQYRYGDEIINDAGIGITFYAEEDVIVKVLSIDVKTVRISEI